MTESATKKEVKSSFVWAFLLWAVVTVALTLIVAVALSMAPELIRHFFSWPEFLKPKAPIDLGATISPAVALLAIVVALVQIPIQLEKFRREKRIEFDEQIRLKKEEKIMEAAAQVIAAVRPAPDVLEFLLNPFSFGNERSGDDSNRDIHPFVDLFNERWKVIADKYEKIKAANELAEVFLDEETIKALAEIDKVFYGLFAKMRQLNFWYSQQRQGSERYAQKLVNAWDEASETKLRKEILVSNVSIILNNLRPFVATGRAKS